MKPFALATAALAALSCSSAIAADLAARPYTKAPVAVAAVAGWTGFYVGGHAGGAWSPVSYNHNETAGVGGAVVTTEAFSTRSTGFSGGVQAGYLHQFANAWVLGIEAGYSWQDQAASAQTVLGGIPRTRETRLHDTWSVAGRLGYAFGPALLYLRGGYANSGLGFSNTLNATGAVLGASRSRVDGYVVGGGLEYAVTRNWSIAGEYNYYDFRPGVQQQALGGVPVAAFNDRIRFDVHQALFRLNYRFGG